MLETILSGCDARYETDCEQCEDCSYGEYCPHDCEKCLDFIHNPSHSEPGSPKRKYDCAHMADFYTCKYSCRYASEIMYAIERCVDLHNLQKLRVLSFGCGPCTDLFAIDALHKKQVLCYKQLEYRGVDYSKRVWQWVHRDIKCFQNDDCDIKFFYEDACDLINTIAEGTWTPNLIVFQYVFSDMQKHTDFQNIYNFINTFAKYYNTKIGPNTYIVLNDINLGRDYGGGREFFDRLLGKLNNSIYKKGRFCNDNSTSNYYPRGYPYGDDSDGEFTNNANRFDLTPWKTYSPFNTCASAQMIIKKVEKT
ncbi:MAG: hypothetical protein IJE14_00270 [Clostridia bacterium]|nr:hypothetical protein [Clostridia bacterium]